MQARVVWYRCWVLFTLHLEHVPQRVNGFDGWVCTLTVTVTQS